MRERNFLVHPYYILITLVLGSITALFLGFSAAYIYSRVSGHFEPVRIPQLFYWNSLILIATSVILHDTKRAYENDQTQGFLSRLYLSLILSLTFLGLQILAWAQMHAMNIGLSGTPLESYLYVLSGVHFLHLVLGIPFLALFIIDAKKRLVEPTSILLYLSDPEKKRKLKVLTIYWHFLDLLWIYLVIFFLLNRLI